MPSPHHESHAGSPAGHRQARRRAPVWSAAMSRRASLALPALLIAAFAINLDTTIVNVALPTLARELHASNSQLQWIVDAYNLVFAAFLLAAGSLSDRVGRKGMLLAGLGLFGASSAAGGLAADSTQLIVARCLMGLGAAMVFPSTLSLISNIFTGRAERARAIGLWGATAGMAIALGPIVGGWLLGRFTWAEHLLRDGAGRGARRVARGAPRAELARRRREGAGPRRRRPLDGWHLTARVHDHRGARPGMGQRPERRGLR